MQHSSLSRLAGFLYVSVIVLALVNGFVLEPRIAALSAQAVAPGGGYAALVRLSMMIQIIMYVAVIGLGLSLGIFLEPLSPGLARGASALRVVEGALGGLFAFVSGFSALYGSGLPGPGPLAFVAELCGQGLYLLMLFMGIAGLIFFALFLRSRALPRFLSIWGLVTYGSMLLVSLGMLALPALVGPYAMIPMVPGSLFELTVGLWLLFKGAKLS